MGSLFPLKVLFHPRSIFLLVQSFLSCCFFYHDDDPDFRFRIKSRHCSDSRLNRHKSRPKDLKEDEFLLFREALQNLFKVEKEKGELLAALATFQYYQAFRIFEVAALNWEDIFLDWKTPSNSRVKVARLVVWPRKKEIASYIEDGFKNSKSNDGVKEQPLFPETFDALSQLYFE